MRLLTGWFTVACLIVALSWCSSPVGAQSKESGKYDSYEYGGKTIDQWIKEMRHPTDPSVRHSAIRAVIHCGSASKQAVPNLLSALKETDPGLRGDAATSLGIIAAMDGVLATDDVNRVVQGLAALLGTREKGSYPEEQRSVRVHACLALARIGARANKAIPQLTDAAVIKDVHSWELRKTVCYTLGRVGVGTVTNRAPDSKALLALVDRLHDSCAPVRLEAIMALSALGPPKPDEMKLEMKGLEPLLADTDKRVAIWSRVLIMYLDDKLITEKGLSHLVAYLHDDKEADIRITAAHALGTLGAKAKSKINDLVAAAQDPEPRVILDGAIPALTMMARAGQAPALNKLEALIQDKEVPTKVRAIQNIMSLGDIAKPVIPSLIAALNDPDSQVVVAVIQALVFLPAAYEASLKPLQEMAKSHKDEIIRKGAAEGVKIIQDRLKTPPKKP